MGHFEITFILDLMVSFIGNSLSMCSHVCKGKDVYIWISPNLTKVGLILIMKVGLILRVIIVVIVRIV